MKSDGDGSAIITGFVGFAHSSVTCRADADPMSKPLLAIITVHRVQRTQRNDDDIDVYTVHTTAALAAYFSSSVVTRQPQSL